MGLIVKGGYLPGFTEPERNQELEAYLTKRGYDSEDGHGGAEIAHYFHSQIMSENIELLVGSKGFEQLGSRKDLRNRIIASCARSNCMSAMWWLVEREGKMKWVLYSGVWNEDIGFMVLDAPEYHPIPMVWLTQDFQGLRRLLDLSVV